MIKPIDSWSIDQITSGQVVTSLSSTVKELIENSLDAGSTVVELKLTNHGRDGIRIQDNGCGVNEVDFDFLAMKHATSKLEQFADLGAVTTLGFRGEALASLCALAQVSIITSTGGGYGYELEFGHDGKIVKKSKIAIPKGTIVQVDQLFHNLPVRRKDFERNCMREYTKAVSIIQEYALLSSARITLEHITKNRSNLTLRSQGAQLMQRIACVYGFKRTKTLCPVEFTPEQLEGMNLRVSGYISKPAFGMGDSATTCQLIAINGRPSQQPRLTKMIVEMYKQFNLNETPFFILNITLSTDMYDVNISPDKRSLLLHNEGGIIQAVRQAFSVFFGGLAHSVPRAGTDLPPSKRPKSHFLSFAAFTGSGSVIEQNEKRNTLHQPKSEENAEDEDDVDEETMVGNADVKSVSESVNRSVTGPESELEQRNEHSFENDDDEEADNEDMCQVEPTEITETGKGPETTNVEINGESEECTKPNDISANGLDGSLSDSDISETMNPVSETNSAVSEIMNTVSETKNTVNETKSIDSEVAEAEDNEPVEYSRDSVATPKESYSKNAVTPELQQVSNTRQTARSTCCSPVPSPSPKSQQPQNSLMFEIKQELGLLPPDSPTTEPQPEPPTYRPSSHRMKTLNTHIHLPLTIDKIASAVKSSNIETDTPVNRLQNLAIDEEGVEERLQLSIQKNDFDSMEVVGQFNLGFILVVNRKSNHDDLFVIDQHASDEIYNFERLQRNTILSRQPLITPHQLELSAVEELMIQEHMSIFENNGFSIGVRPDEPPGHQCYLESVPFSKSTIFDDKDVFELLGKVKEEPNNKDIRCSKLRAMFAMRACRSSIMVGRALDMNTMRRIVRHLGTLEKPWNCPHGRPTLRHITSLS